LRSPTKLLAKTWCADGSISQYDKAMYFKPRQEPVANLQELSTLLTRLESSPHVCAIRGQYKGDAHNEASDPEHKPNLTRRLSKLFDDVPHHWLLIEVDEFEPLADSITETDVAIEEYLLSHLPDEFNGCSYHWQLSNSAGHPSKVGKLKVHLWFWSERAYTSAELKAWARSINLQADLSVMQPVQVHYTAAPVMADGVICPVWLRSGFHAGVMGCEVPLVIDQAVIDTANRPAHTSAYTEPVELALLAQMTRAISPDCDYDTWLHVGMALHHETEGSDDAFLLWDDWSSHGVSYPGTEALQVHWASFGSNVEGPPITRGTLTQLATEAGWTEVLSDDVWQAAPTEVGEAQLELPTFDRHLAGPNAGHIKPVLNNILLALARPDVCGVYVAHDDFKDEAMYSLDGERWRLMKEETKVAIRARLELGGNGFCPIPSNLFDDAMILTLSRNRIDVAKVWLKSLEWDGVPRVARFFEDYMWVDAVDVKSGYATALSHYWWTALAGRVLDPGCQVDTVPVLIGEQGVLKSSMLKAMLPNDEYFAEIHLNASEDNSARLMRGKLVGELSELRGLHTRDLESIKAFVTRREEHWVPKYREFANSYPRRLLLVGTTNEEEFLADITGNRRWAPIHVGVGGLIDVAGVKAAHQQLWAEAAHLYHTHKVMWQDMTQLAAKVHQRHIIEDTWQGKVREWLDSPLDFEDGTEGALHKGTVLTASHILDRALHIPVAQHDVGKKRRVAHIMRALGYEQVWGGGNHSRYRVYKEKVI
jgi:virulence-associated protein E/primase-like protein